MPRTKQPASACSKVNTAQDRKVTSADLLGLSVFYPSLTVGSVSGTDDMYDEQTEDLENPLRCPIKLYDYYLFKW